MARGKDLFLAVERQVIAIFSNDDRRQQAGRGDGTLLQRVQGREDRRGKGMIAPHIVAAPAAAQMALRGIEERRSRVTRCAARCGV